MIAHRVSAGSHSKVMSNPDGLIQPIVLHGETEMEASVLTCLTQRISLHMTMGVKLVSRVTFFLILRGYEAVPSITPSVEIDW